MVTYAHEAKRKGKTHRLQLDFAMSTHKYYEAKFLEEAQNLKRSERRSKATNSASSKSSKITRANSASKSTPKPAKVIKVAKTAPKQSASVAKTAPNQLARKAGPDSSPLPPPRYPNMRATNLKVNRYKPAKKKSEPNIPFTVDVGDVVYYVSTESYYRRRIHFEELQEEASAARVVGESWSCVGSQHEGRQLQLRSLTSGELWYEPETKFSQAHFF
jgi:hypothetical protein